MLLDQIQFAKVVSKISTFCSFFSHWNTTFGSITSSDNIGICFTFQHLFSSESLQTSSTRLRRYFHEKYRNDILKLERFINPAQILVSLVLKFANSVWFHPRTPSEKSSIKNNAEMAWQQKEIWPYVTKSMTSVTIMMTSSNGNIFRVAGPLCGEFTGHRKGQWRGALMFSLICAWIKGWVNNCEAGDLRPHRANYNVIVMWIIQTDP